MSKLVVVALLASALTASGAQGTNETGQFEYRITRVDIHNRLPGVHPNTWTGATVGLAIKNTGDVPVQIALLIESIKLQIDGGVEFTRLSKESVSGLAICRGYTVADCGPLSKDFTVLRPGRSITASATLAVRMNGQEIGPVKWGNVSGTLFVRETEGGKVWLEPLTVAETPVVNNIR